MVHNMREFPQSIMALPCVLFLVFFSLTSAPRISLHSIFFTQQPESALAYNFQSPHKTKATASMDSKTGQKKKTNSSLHSWLSTILVEATTMNSHGFK